MRPRIPTTHFTRVEIFKNPKDTTIKEDTFLISMDWQHKKTKLQEKFPQLTNEDLEYQDGKLKELIGRIQMRLGKSGKEVIQLIEEL